MRNIGSRELEDWLLFEQSEPFGPAREDTRFGVLACMLSAEKSTPDKFFPNLREFKHVNSLEEDLAAMKLVNDYYGGAGVKGNGLR